MSSGFKQSGAIVAQILCHQEPGLVTRKGEFKVIKKAISYTLTFYVVLTLWQLLLRPEIQWKDNIGLSIAVFLAYLFVEWASKPYKYKKNEK